MFGRPRRLLALLLLLPVAACDDSGAGPPSHDPDATIAADTPTPPAQPSGWDDELSLAELPDLNDDPTVLEVELVAGVAELELLPGTTTPAWTYGGTVPGPLLRANVGDTLVVHFRNELPEATSIHWHGLRVPNEMDGVPGVTQDPVEPGETFEYAFELRDAGLFWYHPHISTAKQVGMGLYGALLVEDPAEPDLGDELVLVLSDMSLDDDGSFHPHDSGGELGILFGHEGAALLANGRVNPVLHARAGLRQRWRLVSAARARYFTVGFDDQTWTLVGGDGGLASEPSALEAPVLVPGERRDVVLEPTGEPGSEVQVWWIPTERGYGSTFMRDPEPLFRVRFAEAEAAEAPALPALQRDIPPIDVTGATELDLELTSDTVDGKVVMGIDHVPYAEVVPIEASLGDTHVWTLTNETDFHHPFHVHGYYFQVLDVDGVPPGPLEWKDSVDVPIDSTVRIALHFDERPGTWMYHCHILEHAEAGMMGQLVVSAADDV